MTTRIIYYNQRGEGVGIYQNKPIYIPFSILNEEIEFEIVEEKEKYYIGKLKKLISPSINRNYNLPKNYEFIGGYELIHMNKEAEKEYKIYNLINTFKKIANIDLKIEDINYFQGEKELRYRNKITLFDGGLKKKKSNEIYYLDDFLLTNIKPQSTKKGKIIIRDLETRIEGHKKENLYTFDSLEDLRFKVSIGSFYQVNKEVCLYVYNKIKELIPKNKDILDLYSGIGTIAAFISNKSQSVTAVEINDSSFKDFIYNIELNNLKNITPVKQDVYKFLKNTQNNFFDVFVVDPDRTGLKKEVVKEISRLLPEKIIYLSCNIATQANDINLLKENYNIEYIEIVNMFPKTFHIENLILLNKK
ncbi:class I SAM-dependent RNA methyltransferase [Mesomycoplasma molare]|uniref:RsmD family RNA methyltransferase n=1 Tax=Mesomycoplasma molare TaxID=171288 RepID=A0ABY5TYK8_9BACT|nr:RsmD family RNA methyltransferase [Mesomycoplasma molare]UWD34119.1 RsmD family RNA methyltransferase [Mesomycoplasma molare]